MDHKRTPNGRPPREERPIRLGPASALGARPRVALSSGRASASIGGNERKCKNKQLTKWFASDYAQVPVEVIGSFNNFWDIPKNDKGWRESTRKCLCQSKCGFIVL